MFPKYLHRNVVVILFVQLMHVAITVHAVNGDIISVHHFFQLRGSSHVVVLLLTALEK